MKSSKIAFDWVDKLKCRVSPPNRIGVRLKNELLCVEIERLKLCRVEVWLAHKAGTALEIKRWLDQHGYFKRKWNRIPLMMIEQGYKSWRG